MWTIWRQFLVFKFRELYAALIQKFSWHYFLYFCQECRLQNIREIATSTSHFGVTFLTFGFSLLLPVLQMGLHYGNLWLKKVIYVNWKKYLLLQTCCSRSPHAETSSFLPHASCTAWPVGFFHRFLGLSARVTVLTAQPAELTLSCKSCPVLVQLKQGSLSSNVIDALELPLLGVKLLNLYFGSWCGFFF